MLIHLQNLLFLFVFRNERYFQTPAKKAASLLSPPPLGIFTDCPKIQNSF